MKRLHRRQHLPHNNNKGIALLIAVFSVGLLIFIATEVSYETNIEYVISSQKINRLQAYYSARAGVELSLLRVLLFKKAIAKYGDQLGNSKNMLDPLWNFPFAWPPTQFIPKDNLSIVAQDQLKTAEKKSLMQGTYITTIESLDGKIDINDLASGIKSLVKSTRNELLKIFQLEIKNNEDFAQKYANTDFDKIINNIQDWVDSDSESLNGGDESSYYQGKMVSPFIPPNQGFKTIEELHMVEGMKDDFYELISKHVTLYGVKGININYAPAETLKILDPQIDDKIAQEIIKRRSDPDQGGLFKDSKEFESYLGTLINIDSFNQDKVPLLFGDPVYNFLIKSTGEYKKSSSEITAITYDVDNLVNRVATMLDERDKENSGVDDSNGGSGSTSEDDGSGNKSGSGDGASDKTQGANGADASKKKSPTIPKGRPRIIYWNEK